MFESNKLKYLFFRDFVFWNLPQVQYKNPDVQVATFKNLTPTPFIKCYYGNTYFNLKTKLII